MTVHPVPSLPSVPGAPPAESDASLIARARSGDLQAGEELYRRYRALVARWSRDCFPNPDAAEDLAAEAWERIWQALPVYREREAFRPWMRRILRNVAGAEARRRRVRQNSGAAEVGFEELDLAAFPASEGSPDRFLLEEERWQALCAALAALHRARPEQARSLAREILDEDAPAAGPLSNLQRQSLWRARQWLRRYLLCEYPGLFGPGTEAAEPGPDSSPRAMSPVRRGPSEPDRRAAAPFRPLSRRKRTWHVAAVALQAVVLAALLGLLPAGLAGCSSQPARPAAELYAGWDASESCRDELPALVEAGSRLARRFEPEYDHVTLYRVESETAEFYDNAAPSSLESLQDLLVRELEGKPAVRGTRPGRFWAAVAARLEKSRRPAVVVLLTDGDNDDQTARGAQELHSAVARLAACANLRRVCLWGVRRGDREALRTSLAPLGDRLELRGIEDMDPATAIAALGAGGGGR